MSEQNEASVQSVVRPAAICCPHCGRVVEFVAKGGNYPCERCGVLWRWYRRPGTTQSAEIGETQ